MCFERNRVSSSWVTEIEIVTIYLKMNRDFIYKDDNKATLGSRLEDFYKQTQPGLTFTVSRANWWKWMLTRKCKRWRSRSVRASARIRVQHALFRPPWLLADIRACFTDSLSAFYPQPIEHKNENWQEAIVCWVQYNAWKSWRAQDKLAPSASGTLTRFNIFPLLSAVSI